MGIERVEDLTPPEVLLSSEEREVLHTVYVWAEMFFKNAEEKGTVVMGAHGFDHNQRVAGMAGVLATLEGKDPFLPILTALIFDIGRTNTDPRAHNWHHGELSLEMASGFIDSLPLLNEEDRVLVKNAIEDHPKLNEDVSRSYVVEIVMDADRLDTIGALGPVRAAATRWRLPLYTGEEEASREEDKLTSVFQDFAFRLPDFERNLWTASARKIAKPRMEFMREFIDEYEKEAGFMDQAFKNLQI